MTEHPPRQVDRCGGMGVTMGIDAADNPVLA